MRKRKHGAKLRRLPHWKHRRLQLRRPLLRRRQKQKLQLSRLPQSRLPQRGPLSKLPQQRKRL